MFSFLCSRVFLFAQPTGCCSSSVVQQKKNEKMNDKMMRVHEERSEKRDVENIEKRI
jgi:hypothetical protein